MPAAKKYQNMKTKHNAAELMPVKSTHKNAKGLGVGEEETGYILMISFNRKSTPASARALSARGNTSRAAIKDFLL